MKRRPRGLFYFLLAGSFCLATVSCTHHEPTDTIRIGEFIAMTGPEAAFGQSSDKGIRLAVDEANAQGGIRGKMIRLISADRTGTPSAIVKRLITKDHVLAILGEIASGRSLAAAPIAQQLKVPMISPSSTNPKVTQIGNYIFRTCFIDPFQGPVMASFAYQDLKLRKVAILMDQDSDYSRGLTEFFRKKFEKLGGKIVTVERFTAGDTDFAAQLKRLRRFHADGIYIPAYYPEVGRIAQQARVLKIKLPLLGSDGWDSPRLFEIGGKAIQGAYFSSHYSAENPAAQTKAFIKAFQEKYHDVPNGLAASGYDAARVLIAAMRRAAKLNSRAIRDEVAKTTGYHGATGTITINVHRNADKDVFVVQIKDHGLKFIKAFHH